MDGSLTDERVWISKDLGLLVRKLYRPEHVVQVPEPEALDQAGMSIKQLAPHVRQFLNWIYPTLVVRIAIAPALFAPAKVKQKSKGRLECLILM